MPQRWYTYQTAFSHGKPFYGNSAGCLAVVNRKEHWPPPAKLFFHSQILPQSANLCMSQIMVLVTTPIVPTKEMIQYNAENKNVSAVGKMRETGQKRMISM